MAPRSPLADRPDLDVPSTYAASAAPVNDPVQKEDGAGMFKAAKAALAKQPKRTIRLPEDAVVIVNGYPFEIKGRTTVEVPETVAQIIEQAQEFGRF